MDLVEYCVNIYLFQTIFVYVIRSSYMDKYLDFGVQSFTDEITQSL